MTNIRLIARLDIKGQSLIKSIQLEGVQVVGCPKAYAKKYYDQGADEILFMDAVASLYGRNHLSDIITTVSEDIFIPITVGGGLRTLSDIDDVLKSGADKVAINTAIVQNPKLISQVADHYGSQCMVAQIDAKYTGSCWEVYTDAGREKTDRDCVDWAKEVVDRGAGEILLTAVDREGTGQGFDLSLIQQVSEAVSIPVIACGGMQSGSDFVAAIQHGRADAVATAHALHIENHTISQLKSAARAAGIEVR